MDQDLYGLQASGIDPEIAAQMLGLKRSRGVAEALLKQSMTPLSAGPTPQGGFTPRIHPLQGIAQIVQAYMARKGLEDADTTQAGLAKQNEERTASALGDYEKQRAGTPGMTPLTPNDDEGNANTSIAATPGDPRAAIANLLAKNAWLSKNPLVQADMAAMKPMVLGRTLVNGTGQTLATDSTWAAEQKAAAEAKKAAQIDSLAAKEEENRVKIEAAAERQRQAAADREAMVRLAGSLRQPVAPTVTEIVRPDGRVVKIDAKTGQEIGLSPADTKVQGILNQDTAALQSSTADLDRLALEANKVLNHPGLPGITGVRGAIPNIPGTNAADAQALLGTLKSQVGFGVLQTMRNNSKTGGALGNVSDAEGKRLEANLASLEKAQSLPQFKESLKQILDFTDQAKERLRSAYNIKHSNAEQPQRRASDKNTVLKFDAQGNPVQ